jgi:hypothetical protein|tara:strand:- start:539 stop:1129 length:591 start_codon:yes stop_codon:yes gene_type:complete
MAILFDEILTKGVRAGQMPARTQAAREWYRNSAKDYKRISDTKLMKGDTSRLTAQPLVGQMYMYYYDAKHKATLPYFDRFPLVFPFKKVKGGFYGLNMHYLPLPLRAKLMDALYDTASNTRFDESTRLRMSYKMLESAAKYKEFQPCIKRYLTSQLRSKFMYIYPSEWDMALFLPLERFQGASKTQVWADSKRKIG